MFIFLSKLLPLFIYPPGCVLLVVITAVIIKEQRQRTSLLILAVVLLWLPSTELVSHALMASLETQHDPLTQPLPQAEVIVVLGGSTLPAQSPRTLPGLNETAERLHYAAWLYEQGVADTLLLTGGGIEWLNGSLPIAEAEDMAVHLQLLGVDEGALWLEVESRNTYENALYSKEILTTKGIDTIVLVTSASHMPRSVRIFEKQGFVVIPAPTDFEITQAEELEDRFWHKPFVSHLWSITPTSNNLSITNKALKEYLGIIVYRWREWL